ncbi:NAD(P)H-quinone oxidoreductase [Chelativorans sp. AA-79]|uniref:NAD(P)H-quinone oxidoreductase n=1 Tax=Chelativorans sp. AA-79 TaxID=3028735 RepID=UPI0023F73328|nr:NAD(P)H-quinone oxidoreductase [Chelativorans sp. AA-79]WEX10937.1 NAD(P)H-quinone oxidoreductase [Chelativorans sp. AA-79]
MRVVEIRGAGGPEVLHLAEQPKPQPGPADVVIRVIAASVNRPDIQQRRGLYPPPPDASPIPGLDVSGIVDAVGAEVSGIAVGDAVCALTNGGGYAEFCVVPAVQCMPVPAGCTFAEAAALPEAFFTAWNNVIWGGRLAEGESLLVQGGTSGVGMAAIQIARQLRRATVYATAGTDEKRRICLEMGAQAAVDYRGDWDKEILRLTAGKGVDVILDAQAGPYTQRQLDLLNADGRLVFIASHQDETAEVNIRKIVRRRLSLSGSTIRPQPPAYKGRLAEALVREVWPLLEARRIVNRIHAILPFEEVRKAHGILDRNEQIGKVVLAVDTSLAETRPGSARNGGCT